MAIKKQVLNFYDVKTKKKFNTSDWTHKTRGGRHFAVTVNPKSKVECWRTIGAAVLGTKKPTKKAKPCKKKK